MSDENLTNNEETAALFVSNKKKKQAEEEAKRRAEEEQARREAAEAEVRRMEQEVEERKRRAEEERLALEEEERALAEGRITRPAESQAKPEPAKKAKKPAAAKDPGIAGGKSKLPVFIGIGAAVIVVIIIAVVALGGKGGSGSSAAVTEMDTAQLNDEFNMEYVSKEEGYDLKFMYPAGMYTEVTEEKGDGELTIHFGPQGIGMIDTDIILTDYKWADRDEIIMDYDQAACPPNKFQSGFQDRINARIKELIPDAAIADEVSTDVSAEDAGRYFYKCTFTSAEKGNGAVSAWVAVNSKGECKRAIVCCRDTSEDKEACRKLCDTFTEKYSGESLMVPGFNPPTSTDTDGQLEVEEMHMGILAPKDQFKRYTLSDAFDLNYSIFMDKNGASVIVNPIETDIDLSGDNNYTRDQIHGIFDEMAAKGVNSYFTDLDSRMLLDESYDSRDTTVDYTGNYRDMIGGISYWERYRIGYWTDVRTQKHYFYILITLVPEKNRDVYQQIFDRSLDMLKDI